MKGTDYTFKKCEIDGDATNRFKPGKRMIFKEA